MFESGIKLLISVSTSSARYLSHTCHSSILSHDDSQTLKCFLGFPYPLPKCAKIWKHLAGVLTAWEPIHACSVAALLVKTTVVDATVSNAVTVTLAAEQVVARCVTGFGAALAGSGRSEAHQGDGNGDDGEELHLDRIELLVCVWNW